MVHRGVRFVTGLSHVAVKRVDPVPRARTPMIGIDLCYGGNQPADLWEHTMHYYVYVHNLTPRKELDDKSPWGIFTKRREPSLPKFYFGKHVTYYVDDKRRQTTAAKQMDPLGRRRSSFQEEPRFYKTASSMDTL